MTVEQFKTLRPEIQTAITWHKGVLLAYRTETDAYICLYRFLHFYVEVKYSSGADGVASVTALKDEDSLAPYLSTIDLSDLIALC